MKSCNFCEKSGRHFTTIDSDCKADVVFAYGEMILIGNHGAMYGIKLKYCPYCGSRIDEHRKGNTYL